MSVTCLCCNKPLTVRESQIRGIGPICAAKRMPALEAGDDNKVDLPFDPETMDILVERRDDGLHVNIHQTIHHHSPSGFEIGYGGSGPADFALNILELFFRNRGERPTMAIGDFINGERHDRKICKTAWSLHQDFKEEFLATMNRDGGRIPGRIIDEWINIKIKVAERERPWSLAA